MDRWFEEDEPVYANPPRPAPPRRRPVVIAPRHRPARPKLLFETGNPVRYYLPFADVDLALLTRSDTISECPYQGDGQRWHLTVDGERIPDAAWSLPHPLPEDIPATEHICIYPSKAYTEADGEHITE